MLKFVNALLISHGRTKFDGIDMDVVADVPTVVAVVVFDVVLLLVVDG